MIFKISASASAPNVGAGAGPHQYVIDQIKEAVRDGLRAVKNVLEDECVLPGENACMRA
eukprot:COSAG01_NODE_147_length_24095_cov_25.855428_10_plen_59_part_00